MRTSGGAEVEKRRNDPLTVSPGLVLKLKCKIPTPLLPDHFMLHVAPPAGEPNEKNMFEKGFEEIEVYLKLWHFGDLGFWHGGNSLIIPDL